MMYCLLKKLLLRLLLNQNSLRIFETNMSADKPIHELEYKDLIKTGLPVSFGSTHVVLSEMVTEFRNNRCQVVS